MKSKNFFQGIGMGLLGSLAVILGNVAAAPLPGGSLDPTTIPKYVSPLVIPPEMPKSNCQDDKKKPDQCSDYKIAVRQFKQQILPQGFPKTKVWGYGSIDAPDTAAKGGSFFYPGFTIETRTNQAITVKWVNDLVKKKGKFLPHVLTDTVDQTLHWANPPAKNCMDGTNHTDCAVASDKSYKGPIPIVTHVHGAVTNADSDGYPEAWWLPDAKNIPKGYEMSGTLFDDAAGLPNGDANPGDLGYAIFEYPNKQNETTLWYHDHALGITRLNVYAGLAGFWLIRDDNGQEKNLNLPGPSPRVDDEQGNNPFGKYYEIPLVIQDRSFNKNGSLFYPKHRAFFERIPKKKLKIKFAPETDIAKRWNPEAFFNVMVVNGVSWPYLDVDKARYRFRILNGSNSRTLNLALFVVNVDGSLGEEIPMWVIGGDQGLLSDVVKVTTGKQELYDDETGTIHTINLDPAQALLMASAERMDVIVDFTKLATGTKVRMINTAPDTPFGGFPDFSANPQTTGQVMQFVVGPNYGPEFAHPGKLSLADHGQLDSYRTRYVSLNEEESSEVCVLIKPDGLILQLDNVNPGPSFKEDCKVAGGVPFAPRQALLGVVDQSGMPIPLLWSDPITENPFLGTTEEWVISNFTEDAHPIHLHLVKFKVVGRESIDGVPTDINVLPFENGFKDIVIAYPGEVTRIRARFNNAGLYVWHCHILEHEDNEMMRPFCVGNPGEDCPAELF